MAADILVVDDEEDIRDLVTAILEDEGYETRSAANGEEAMAAIGHRRPSLVILDIWLQSGSLDGLAVLDKIKELHPELQVVMISGHGNIETAVSAIKRGAYDYIEKPFNSDRLILITQRALEASKLRREVRELKERNVEFDKFIGNSKSIESLRQNLEKISPTNSRVLIYGPSGSGKELAARTIHRLSNRSDGPFVVLNAAAIIPERMEEELFGVEDSNGTQKIVGAFEEAHGGTLYLDEIGDMPRETQNKILRVLTDQTFTRVSGSTKVEVDIRIVSSSTKNLENEVSKDNFREDLFHRLNVVPLLIPSLSEYLEDIPLLVNYFMEQISKSAGMPKRRISPEVMMTLKTHDWPGNVRQLRNNIERLMILTRSDDSNEITPDLLPAEVGSLMPMLPNASTDYLMNLPMKEARLAFERDYLQSQLTRFNGNIKKTSDFIGMERAALHRKLKSLDAGGRISN